MLLTADRIHDGYHFLPQGAMIEVAEDGAIVGKREEGRDRGEVEIVKYEGTLCPGFVNAHCHLELSHMAGVIPKGTGLIPFLQTVIKHRGDFTEEQVKAARHEAYVALVRNGVVAVGDIANTTDTLDLRKLDALHIHTFIESLGFTDTHAQQRFEYSKTVYDAFAAQKGADKILHQSIVPHAPYSVSEALFRIIDGFQPQSLLSVHNQECAAENEYYTARTGDVRDLFRTLNINDGFFKPSGISSVRTYGQWLSPTHPLLLVHNTVTKREDIEFIKKRFRSLSFCLCPNANLYIEACLPDIPMLAASDIDICIGTDSLASNDGLSIFAELETIDRHFPEIGWETLLRWATSGGATALGMNDVIGSFEKGKKPGIVQINDSAIKRII